MHNSAVSRWRCNRDVCAEKERFLRILPIRLKALRRVAFYTEELRSNDGTNGAKVTFGSDQEQRTAVASTVHS